MNDADNQRSKRLIQVAFCPFSVQPSERRLIGLVRMRLRLMTMGMGMNVVTMTVGMRVNQRCLPCGRQMCSWDGPHKG